ncbi:hypothetical protein PB1_08012 [Bacillus methanolicus PB1]|uniref:Uncharacterized protein n=1 Tax=Bacillus methanolicus PB1 TaxID=997296 RepID=I3E1B9_BACMT|nr:hypothetical protein PB1_08012 [Bacillus methanolicus PB1]
MLLNSLKQIIFYPFSLNLINLFFTRGFEEKK